MKIIVTGGASGIGLAISEALLQNADEVLICYHRSAQSAQQLQQSYKNAHIFQADVADTAALDAMFTYAKEIFNGGAALWRRKNS